MIGRELQPREKVMAVITAVGVIFAIAYYSGLSDVIDSAFSGSGDVVSLERRFESNLEALERMYEIQSEFGRVGEFPSTDGGTLKPGLAFTQQVQQMCADLGFTFPPIRADPEPIEGVSDYELINVALKTEGTFEDTVKLLKTFEEEGLIFREIDLNATRDRPIITTRVTVARIAPIEVREMPRSRLDRRR